MKQLIAVLALAVMTTACVPAVYSRQAMPPGYPGGRGMYGPAARYQISALPIGRWDNVMMLAAGTPVQVLTMDGGMTSGQMVAADAGALHLRVASGQVELASADVMRVDRLAAPGSAVRDGARGAAVGAGVVGVLGLIAGRMPPPRLFAVGGIVGAAQGVEVGADGRGAATIYLAAAAAPGVGR